MNIKPKCPNCKSCNVLQTLDQVFLCRTCKKSFECPHEFIVDGLKMFQIVEHGTVAKPLKICLACGEIVLELP